MQQMRPLPLVSHTGAPRTLALGAPKMAPPMRPEAVRSSEPRWQPQAMAVPSTDGWMSTDGIASDRGSESQIASPKVPPPQHMSVMGGSIPVRIRSVERTASQQPRPVSQGPVQIPVPIAMRPAVFARSPPLHFRPPSPLPDGHRNSYGEDRVEADAQERVLDCLKQANLDLDAQSITSSKRPGELPPASPIFQVSSATLAAQSFLLPSGEAPNPFPLPAAEDNVTSPLLFCAPLSPRSMSRRMSQMEQDILNRVDEKITAVYQDLRGFTETGLATLAEQIDGERVLREAALIDTRRQLEQHTLNSAMDTRRQLEQHTLTSAGLPQLIAQNNSAAHTDLEELSQKLTERLNEQQAAISTTLNAFQDVLLENKMQVEHRLDKVLADRLNEQQATVSATLNSFEEVLLETRKLLEQQTATSFETTQKLEERMNEQQLAMSSTLKTFEEVAHATAAATSQLESEVGRVHQCFGLCAEAHHAISTLQENLNQIKSGQGADGSPGKGFGEGDRDILQEVRVNQKNQATALEEMWHARQRTGNRIGELVSGIAEVTTSLATKDQAVWARIENMQQELSAVVAATIARNTKLSAGSLLASPLITVIEDASEGASDPNGGIFGARPRIA